MMDGGKYAPEITPTAGKIVASVIVAGWIFLAWHHDGLELAGWALRLLLIPLAMVWIPDLMARLTNIRTSGDLVPPSPWVASSIRIIGWFVILGVPVWWAFVLATTGD